MTALYIYGIIPSGDRIIFDEAGVDDDHDEVYTIPSGGLSAVVSATTITHYRGMKRDEAARYLVTHQRIVELVMQHFTVLPVKFGTVLPDEDHVHRLLVQGKSAFCAALERCAGLAQMEVVALWNLQDVFEQIGRDDRIVALKRRIAGRTQQESMEERVQAGQLVKMLMEERRTEFHEMIASALKPIGVDHVINPVLEDGMVTNVGLLLDNHGQRLLDARLSELDRSFNGTLTFRCIGPLPPYSFATVEVQVPSIEAVETARRQLRIGDSATLNEIKRAYSV